MDENKIMKRLYIGGLNHSVSQSELQQRFGKFGDVTDVDIVTRRDEQGTPVKTFGYLNINITDGELRKCISVLNKTKWKGGTLYIELAKESFLHRLAQERQQAAEKKQTPQKEQKPMFMDSLKNAGVENFHMKSAVPGTEVPGHKDWVVSKFGRVLPVLHLKDQGKNKIVKYDPSKHSHNIKKLDQTADFQNSTPISHLTWEVSGGDDEISKKRRGEFPPPKIRPKKATKDPPSKSEKAVTDSDFEVVSNRSLHCLDRRGVNLSTSNLCANTAFRLKAEEKTILNKNQPAALKTRHRSMGLFDSDVDSEEEIRMFVRQENIHNKSLSAEEMDTLEVVGDDFIVKPNAYWSQQKAKNGSSRMTVETSREADSDREYDSADTDEIITLCKTPAVSVHQRERAESKITAQNEPQSHLSAIPLNGSDSKPSKSTERAKNIGSKKKRSPPSSPSESDSSSSDEGSEESGDSEYEAMMENCYRLEMSLADLERLANESAEPTEEDGGEREESGSQAGSGQEPEPTLHSEIKSKTPLPSKKGNTPEDILAAILAEDSSDEENDRKRKKKKTLPLNLPTFKGTKTLVEAEPRTELGLCPKRKQEEDHLRAEPFKKQKMSSTTRESQTSSSEASSSEDEMEAGCSKLPPFKGIQPIPLNDEKKAGSENRAPSKHLAIDMDESESGESDLESSSSHGTDTIAKPEPKEERTNRSKACEDDSSSSSDSSGDSMEESDEEEEMEKKVPPKVDRVQNTPLKQAAQSTKSTDLSRKPVESVHKAGGPVCKNGEDNGNRSSLSTSDNLLKQQQDNEKRLAALQQRQREAEQQKKLIQGALSKLDMPQSSKGKHIVFDSDEEIHEEPRRSEAGAESCTELKKTLFEEEDDSSGQSSSEEETEALPKPDLSAKEYKKQAAGKLFDSSDEEEEVENEEDEKRFQIKPQFEGKSGHKLMAMQSRFGTDERFRMDSRFLDSEEESNDLEEIKEPHTSDEVQLEEEKKKNLEILQGLLNISIQTPESTKETAKNKTFRDVGALHYDPTREEHAAFETKMEETKKERQAARRKKREQAEKLPEVSKEIYYNIAVDLKEAFGGTNEKPEEKQDVAWDEEEEVEEAMEEDAPAQSQEAQHASGPSASISAAKDDATGFKFSFFGDDAVEEPSAKAGDYTVELLKSAKVSWQEDPRFQESSSEGEDEELGEQALPHVTTREPLPAKKTTFFFFFQDDERLKEGPQTFCRTGKLEEERGHWEEKRTLLIEEYRKKHKDARRKVMAKQRT
ncbi:NOL8 protein, partial [Amia calva]|nr:NOL8 protein [Amia calva]